MTRRLRKTFVVGLLIVALGFVAAVLLLPRVLSGPLGAALVVRLVPPTVHGTVTVDRLEVAWTGEQVVRGLHVETTDGTPVAEVDVTVRAGLLALARGAVDRWSIGLEGRVDLVRRPDGTWTLAEVLASGGGTGALPALPVTLSLDNLALRLDDRSSGQQIELREVTGFVEAGPGGPLEISLEARSSLGGTDGTITVEGALHDGIDGAGRVGLDGASLTLEVAGDAIPLLVADEVLTIERYRLEARSDDLARQVDVAFTGSTSGAEPGTWEGEITLADLLDDSGRLVLGPEQVSGRIVGRQVPVVWTQAALGPTILDAGRDIGPRIDVEFTAGAAPERVVSLVASGAQLEVEVRGAMDADDGSWRGEHLRVAGAAHPDLLAALGPLRAEERVAFLVELTSFTVPRLDRTRLAFADAGGRGSLAVTGPVVVGVDDTMTVVRLETSLEATAFVDGVRVRGAVNVDGAPVTFDAALSGLTDEDWRPTPETAHALGRFECEQLPRPWLERLAGEQFEAVEHLVGASVAALVVTSEEEDGTLVFDVGIEGGDLQTRIVAARPPGGEVVEVRRGGGRLPVTPELFNYLRGGVPGIVRLAHPTALEVELVPFSVTLGAEGPAPTTVAFTIASPGAPGLLGDWAKPVAITDFAGRGEFRTGPTLALALSGVMDVREETADAPKFGRFEYHVDVDDLRGVPSFRGAFGLADVDVAALERVIGEPPGALSVWTGERASLDVRRVDRADDVIELDMQAACSAFETRMTLVIDDGEAVLSSEPFAVMIGAAELNTLLGEDLDADRSPPVASDLPLTATIRRLAFPATREGEFGLAAFDVTLTGGPVQIDGGKSRAVVDQLEVQLERPEYGGPVRSSGRGRTTLTGGPTGDVSGTVTFEGRLPAPTSESDTVATRLEVNLSAEHLPTVIPDELFDLGGLLPAVVGPEMTITVGSDPGRFDFDVTSERGTIQVRTVARGTILATPEGESLRAELAVTPEICEQLLRYIHPILAGIASADQPLRLTVANVTLPIDGDLTDLNGEVTLEIGAVRFRAEAGLLAPVDTFTESVSGEATSRTVPGRVSRISARIEAGVLTYERFVIGIGEYELTYTGTIDLVRRELDIRAEVPVGALDGVIQNIPVIPTGIVVPVRNHGPFTDITTDVEVGGLITNLPRSLLGKLLGSGQPDGD